MTKTSLQYSIGRLVGMTGFEVRFGLIFNQLTVLDEYSRYGNVAQFCVMTSIQI